MPKARITTSLLSRHYVTPIAYCEFQFGLTCPLIFIYSTYFYSYALKMAVNFQSACVISGTIDLSASIKFFGIKCPKNLFVMQVSNPTIHLPTLLCMNGTWVWQQFSSLFISWNPLFIIQSRASDSPGKLALIDRTHNISCYYSYKVQWNLILKHSME